MNVVYKIFPYHPRLDKFDPMNSFVEEDAQKLANWGFNIIRLLVGWNGLEI